MSAASGNRRPSPWPPGDCLGPVRGKSEDDQCRRRHRSPARPALETGGAHGAKKQAGREPAARNGDRQQAGQLDAKPGGKMQHLVIQHRQPVRHALLDHDVEKNADRKEHDRAREEPRGSRPRWRCARAGSGKRGARCRLIEFGPESSRSETARKPVSGRRRYKRPLARPWIAGPRHQRTPRIENNPAQFHRSKAPR